MVPLNMDQTSIYLDPKLTRTFAEIGTRRVEAVTSGQERTRLSVALTASATGDKVNCLVLLPRKNPLFLFPPGPQNQTLRYLFNLLIIITPFYYSLIDTRVLDEVKNFFNQLDGLKTSFKPWTKKLKQILKLEVNIIKSLTGKVRFHCYSV